MRVWTRAVRRNRIRLRPYCIRIPYGELPYHPRPVTPNLGCSTVRYGSFDGRLRSHTVDTDMLEAQYNDKYRKCYISPLEHPEWLYVPNEDAASLASRYGWCQG